VGWPTWMRGSYPSAGLPRVQADCGEHPAETPEQLLLALQVPITSLRMESGYSKERFDVLMGAALRSVAEYVYALPASRAESHTERGGLLRLAVEASMLAYRRTDGKFLAPRRPTDVRNRERDRAWRYAAFLGALLMPIGRCATLVSVRNLQSSHEWAALSEPLWTWFKREGGGALSISWRVQTDVRASQECSLWIASHLVSSTMLGYLYEVDSELPSLVLQLVMRSRSQRIGEVMEASYQAAVDEDLKRCAVSFEAARPSMPVEARLLATLRALACKKWAINEVGGRLWLSDQGLFISWAPAVADILQLWRAEGLDQLPGDSGVLRRLLVERGILCANSDRGDGLFRIIPIIDGAPRLAIEVVRLLDPACIGRDFTGVNLVRVELMTQSDSLSSSESQALTQTLRPLVDAKPLHTSQPVAKPEQRPMELYITGAPPVGTSENSSNEVDTAADGCGDCTVVTSAPTPSVSPVEAPRIVSPVTTARPVELNRRLRRYGEVGVALANLGELLRTQIAFPGVINTRDGLVVGYPEPAGELGLEAAHFVRECERLGLLAADPDNPTRVIRARKAGEYTLPANYVQLSTSLSRQLLQEPGDRA